VNTQTAQIARDLQYVWQYLGHYDPNAVRAAYAKAGFTVVTVEAQGDTVIRVELKHPATGKDYAVISRGPRVPPNIAVPEEDPVDETPAKKQEEPPLREHVCANCAFWEKCTPDFAWNGTPLVDILQDIDSAGECRQAVPIIHQTAVVQGPIACWPITHADWWCSKHSALDDKEATAAVYARACQQVLETSIDFVLAKVRATMRLHG